MKKYIKDIALAAEMFLFSFILYAVISKLMLGDIYLEYISPASGHWFSALLCSWWIIGSISIAKKMNPEMKDKFRNDVATRLKSLVIVPVGIFS